MPRIIAQSTVFHIQIQWVLNIYLGAVICSLATPLSFTINKANCGQSQYLKAFFSNCLLWLIIPHTTVMYIVILWDVTIYLRLRGVPEHVLCVLPGFLVLGTVCYLFEPCTCRVKMALLYCSAHCQIHGVC